MRKTLITTIAIILILTTNAFADKLRIPFSCYPRQLQEIFAERGIKLDLDGNDRTPDSWGFIKNEGAEYYLYTYYAVTEEELMMVMDMVWEHMGILNKE